MSFHQSLVANYEDDMWPLPKFILIICGHPTAGLSSVTTVPCTGPPAATRVKACDLSYLDSRVPLLAAAHVKPAISD
jgi:hypothetical protein